MKKDIILRLVLVLLMVLPTGHIVAQDNRDNRNDRDNRSLMGTIDETMQDDGYIVISDTKLAFRSSDVEITYRGNSVRSSFLTQGMQVRYRTRSDGSLSEITLIGPPRLLEEINNH
ncbi:MAG: hypothetical protein P8M72_06235 [Gammaproteobacteria bacterium]|nr:hypothetical protein [Gammaproteobacteria bacterium]